jgi:flagellar biosynthesis anti-sigma factor FlgM
MRVNDGSLSGTGDAGRAAETQRPDRGSSGSRTGGATAPANGDRVELSNTLGSLSRSLSSYSSDRSARVQELTAQVASGQYRTDSKATSRSMVSEALAGGHQ